MDKNFIFHHVAALGELLANASGFTVGKSLGTHVTTELNELMFNFIELDTLEPSAFSLLKKQASHSFAAYPTGNIDHTAFSKLMELNQMTWIDTFIAQHLGDLKNFQYQPTLPSFRVRRVENLKDFHQFNHIASTAFGYKKENGLLYFKKIHELDFRMEHIHPYLFEHEGIPVGSTIIATHQDVAGLYWGGVLPEYRNSGFASEAILSYLEIIRDMGMDDVICQNMTPSVKLCQRLGFKPLGSMPVYAHIIP